MASSSGSGGGAATPGWAGAGGVAMGPDAPLAERWATLRAAEADLRAGRASAALAARGPEDGIDTSRPTPPELPTDAWSVIMDHSESCR